MTKLEKEMKEWMRETWKDQIRTAINYDNKVVEENPEDDGTCNFDMVMIKKESTFTYQETIDIFKECGISGADKMSEWGSYWKGYIGLPNYVGQANKNTRWVEAFKKSLEEQGFECSMYYQCD